MNDSATRTPPLAIFRRTLAFALTTLLAGSVTPAASAPRSAPLAAPAPAPLPAAFIERYCAACHNDIDKAGELDLTALAYTPGDPANFQRWVTIHDRVRDGEMPPKQKKRPEPAALASFVTSLATELTAIDGARVAREGRTSQRRLNSYEYENALRDLFNAPWLQIRGQFPDDGEAYRFNKIGEALDVSHVHMLRYMGAADYAMRQALSAQLTRPPTITTRFYARDQRTLTSKFAGNIFNTSPDRMTYPVLGATAQPDVRYGRAPTTVGSADPATRELEAVGWVASNYVTGFTYRWDGFRAPVAGRYRIRFSGYTLWAAPGGVAKRFASENDKVGTSRPPNLNVPDYDHLFPGRRDEPITVYTRNGIMNRRVGEFDLTPEPGVYDLGDVWLLANETLVPDASRLYRSRPNNFKNPLMTAEGAPSVAFRWMEVTGPIYDETSGAGYRLLFGDLPLKANPQSGITVPAIARHFNDEGGRNAGRRVAPLEDVAVEVIPREPRTDAERLIRAFLDRAYRRPVTASDVARFLALFDDRRAAGHSFTEAMFAAYTAALASPGFLFLEEKPGPLDAYALATRLALFLTNSEPDPALRARAASGDLPQPAVLRAETERLLSDQKSRRFVDAFLDYWIDARKIEDTTPSTTLYNDYYLDDALTEAALLETQLFFADLLARDLPARRLIDSDYTFLNERLAGHYGLDGVKGGTLRRVPLPADSVRGGLLTQASILKITANGTTTSPVFRGKWIAERILGTEIPPPPAAVPAVEPDIRGAVTIRQQLDQHRADPSCAACHRKFDHLGFALEGFDIMGATRQRYRAIDSAKPAVIGLGKNGQPFEFHLGLEVDATGELPDGRTFANVREFKKLLGSAEVAVARNLATQLIIYATGAPLRFSDRPALANILESTPGQDYGVRSLVHAIVQSELFKNK
jgi:hypothetical protein